MEILIASLILGCLIGGFIGFIWSALLESKIARFIIVTMFIFSFSLFVYVGMSSENKNFNNGYCVQCGTKYEAITRRNGQTYYECPNCHCGTWY